MKLNQAHTAPSDWPLTTVADVCSRFTSGGTPSRKNQTFYERPGIPWVKTGELLDCAIDDTEEHISQDALDSSSAKLLPSGTVLMAMYGATVGQLGIISRPMACNQACAAMVIDETTSIPRFVYYLLLSQREQIKGSAIGAAQQNLSAGRIKEYKFRIPPLSEQREIASILGALDDKIELNRRMSATLEDMARSLYRSWFVDFDPVHAKMDGRQPAFMDEATAALFPDRFGDDGLPEGWEMSSIYQVARVQYGAPFKSKAFNTDKNGRPLVRIRDLKNHQAGVYTTEVHPKEYLIQPGDTVVGMDGDFTPYTWCAEPSLMNQRICCFVALNERDHAFVRLAIPSLLKAEEDAAVATTVIHLGKKDIDTFTVVSPPPSILQAFGQRANPLLAKTVATGIEAKTLAALRDSLLPKLMSGEIRVGEAREHIEEVA